MNKQELKTRLIIAEGELKDAINDENGCFEEIAVNILKLSLSCKELLDKSSNEPHIQLTKSVVDYFTEELIDAVFLSDDNSVMFCTSMDYESSEIFTRTIYEVSKKGIIGVVKRLSDMCLSYEEKTEAAEVLLKKKVQCCSIEDDIYSLAFEKVSELIGEVEKEVGITKEESDEGEDTWYDELRDDMMQDIYDKIRDFLNKE